MDDWQLHQRCDLQFVNLFLQTHQRISLASAFYVISILPFCSVFRWAPTSLPVRRAWPLTGHAVICMMPKYPWTTQTNLLSAYRWAPTREPARWDELEIMATIHSRMAGTVFIKIQLNDLKYIFQHFNRKDASGACWVALQIELIWSSVFASPSSLCFPFSSLAWRLQEQGGIFLTRICSWRTVTPPPSLCRWAPTKGPLNRAWPRTACPARSTTTSTAPTPPRPTTTTGARWSLMVTTSTLTEKTTDPTPSPSHPPTHTFSLLLL